MIEIILPAAVFALGVWAGWLIGRGLIQLALRLRDGADY